MRRVELAIDPPGATPGDDADLGRLMAFAGEMWHRLVEATANAQNQVLHKS